MAVVKFLQVSDFHLGRPFGWIAPDRRSQRRQDQRRALEMAVQQAIERGVDAILIPGDLFDQECVDADTLSFAVRAFEVAGCPPVFIAPGNHDPYSDVSHYWNPHLLKARAGAWPAHVHVFTSPRWTPKQVPGREDVAVWGRCYIGNVASAERPLAPEQVKDIRPYKGAPVNVALFHGSREGACPPGQAAVAPFSEDEARRSPFAYLAVGHYHTPSHLDGGMGSVRLAYAGAAVGLDISELGRHGAVEVKMQYGDGPTRTALEFVELDRRTVHALEADITGAGTAEQVDRRVAKEMDNAGTAEQDIVTVRLRGRLAKGVRYGAPGPELRARAFYVRVNLSDVRPDYDLELYRTDSSAATETRFACAMLAKIDAEKDPRERAVLESALYYGLDAFRLGEVMPVYEELGE
jgi:exonuclease SbcD